MEESTPRKIRKWLKLASIASGSLGAVMTPLLVMYIEWAPKVRAARGEASATIESLAPAIVELQEIVTKGQKKAGEIDDEIYSMNKNYIALDRRLIRCETYIEMLGNRRNMPKPPPKNESPEWSESMSTMGDAGSGHAIVQQIPRYKVPTTIKNAKETAKARKKQECKIDDPLCGIIE